MSALAMLQAADILEPVILDISWVELVLAAGLLLIAIGLSHWQRVGLTRDIIIGGVRTVVQLVLVGYVLVYIFRISQWYLVVPVLLLMVGTATHSAIRRLDRPPRSLTWIMGTVILVGSGLTLVYVGAVVVRPEPWYNPRYLIPLFGMIVGNAMTAATLAAERLSSEVASRRPEIEAYLALGAAPARAAREPVRLAIRASMLPMLNSLMVVGIVSLPGMMTGQILAGVSPFTAVRYQIVVMFMLMGAVAATGTAVTLWYSRSFFTRAEQLIGKNDDRR